MRSFFTDMKRVFKSWGFWACAAGMVIALLICAASSIMNIGRPGNVVLPGAYEAILENALSSDIVLMAVPILCAIVYAASFVEDVASGFIKLLMSIMLIVNIRKGQFFGVISVLALSLYGFLLNPQTFNTFLRLPEHYMYIANVLTGWASPL